MQKLRSRLSIVAAIFALAHFARADVTVTTASDLATALTTSPAGTRVLLGDNLDLTGWTTVDGFVPYTVILLR